MPITSSGSISYKIPENYLKIMDTKFCTAFIKELHVIFGISLEDFNWDSVGYCEGTAGWYVAFTNTCRKLQLDELFLYYRSLPWYDSDNFDAQLSEKLVTENLLLPELYIAEVARQNHVEIDDIDTCECCGKTYRKCDMIDSTETEDEYDEPSYLCLSCATITKVARQNHVKNAAIQELTMDIKQALKELLHLDESQYFICEKCGKIHFNQHKGTRYCLHCEQEIVPDTAVTVYYKKSLNECDEYRDKLLGKES